MRQEKTDDRRNITNQTFCKIKESETAGDLNEDLGMAFEVWVSSWRITSDLSIQLEHINQFAEIYGKNMSEKEQILYKRLHQEVAEAYKNAGLISSQRELQMTDLMQNLFSKEQDGKDFFGGEDAYECMRILWDSGELIERLKEIIFVDENAGISGVEYILQVL